MMFWVHYVLLDHHIFVALSCENHVSLKSPLIMSFSEEQPRVQLRDDAFPADPRGFTQLIKEEN